jgi:hypothetical protein
MAKPKKQEKPASGQALGGRTSDRIRSGKIPKNALPKGRTLGNEEPKTWAVLRAIGRGLGKGAERRRNGGAS